MLSQRIMTLFVLIATAPPAILGIVLYFMTKAELQETAGVLEADMERAIVSQLLQQNEDLATRLAMQLDERFRSWQHQLETIAHMPIVDLDRPAAVQPDIDALIKADPLLLELTIFDAEGIRLTTAVQPGEPPASGRLAASAMPGDDHGQRVAAQLISAPPARKLRLQVVVPIHRQQSASGYLAGTYDLSPICEQIRAQQEPELGYVYAATQGGIVIEHPEPSRVMRYADPYTDFFSRTAMRDRGTYRAQDMLIGYAKLNTLDWRIVTVLSADVALAPFNDAAGHLQTTLDNLLYAVRQNALFILLVFLILAAATARLMAKDIVSPIQQVVDGIRQVARGDVSSKVPVQREDEIGFLAEAFNHLAEDLRSSREELVFNRHRTEHILESLSDSLIMVDSSARISAINPTAAETLGYTGSSLVGRPIADLFAPSFWTREMDQLIMREELNGREAIIHSSYGERFPVLVSSSILRDQSGNAVGAVIVARDITDQLQVEEDRRRLAAIVQGSSDLIATLSLDGHLLFLNQAGRAMLGIDTVSQLLGRSLADFCPVDRADDIEALYPLLLQEGHAEAELILTPLNSDITIPAHFTFTQLKDPRTGAPTLVAAIGRDITERQEALDQLQRYAAELENSNRELEQFAFVASHDLREPLRKLNNLAELVNRRYRDHLDDKGQQMLGFMTDSAQRMLSLIKDLLEYSRVGTQARDFVMTDINLVVDTALSDLSMSIREKKATVSRENLPSLKVDADQITQVFQNLISNALKFCGDQPPSIEILAYRQGDEWVLGVRDHGIGIDPVHRERIFVIFQRLNADQAGTGIGLAICKKIVERHGGRIWVESREGRGATFYFTLPVDPQQPTREAPRHE